MSGVSNRGTIEPCHVALQRSTFFYIRCFACRNSLVTVRSTHVAAINCGVEKEVGALMQNEILRLQRCRAKDDRSQHT